MKLVADGEWDGKIALGKGRQFAARKRTGAGDWLALRAGIGAECGKVPRRSDSRLRPSLREAILRCRQRLVCLEQFMLQPVEFRVMKYLPPRALRNSILRSRRLPRPFAFPSVGNRCSRGPISRPHGAAEARTRDSR